MTPEQKNAFNKFKNRYFAAVQTDTLLGDSKWGGEASISLERKAKLFWAQAAEAEKEFLLTLGER